MVKDVDGYLLTGSIRPLQIYCKSNTLTEDEIWNITPNPPKETSTQIYTYYV